MNLDAKFVKVRNLIILGLVVLVAQVSSFATQCKDYKTNGDDSQICIKKESPSIIFSLVRTQSPFS